MESSKLIGVLNIIIGSIALILVIVCMSMDTGDQEFEWKYGGDAYTGIQNSAATTANNIVGLSKINVLGFSSILLIIGLSLIVKGISQIRSSGDGATQVSNCQQNTNPQRSQSDKPAEADRISPNDLMSTPQAHIPQYPPNGMYGQTIASPYSGNVNPPIPNVQIPNYGGIVPNPASPQSSNAYSQPMNAPSIDTPSIDAPAPQIGYFPPILNQ